MTDDLTVVATALLEAATDGRIADVRAMISDGAPLDALGSENGSALCLAARFGHADIVDTLLAAGANRHIGGGPGYWAYNSPAGIQWDVLAVTRADPALVDIWRSGGLPVERRDNYTMTELTIHDQPSVKLVGLSADAKVAPGQVVNVFDCFANPAVSSVAEPLRCGPLVAVYSGFVSHVSTRFDDDALFDMTVGVITDSTRPGPAPLRSIATPAGRYASAFIKGPFTQLGFAHYSLRHWIDGAGLRDLGTTLVELYHYVEAAVSDANIVEVRVAIS